MNLLQYKCCKPPTSFSHLWWPSSRRYDICCCVGWWYGTQHM